MASELINNIVAQSDIDEKTKKKLKFYTQLFIDTLSPANFIATNPEVIKLAQQTNGESLKKGFSNLLNDIKLGRISQTDFSAFEVGRNLAITPGSVIFENEILQFINTTNQATIDIYFENLAYNIELIGFRTAQLVCKICCGTG